MNIFTGSEADGFVRGAGAPSFDFDGISPEAQAFYILMETAAEKYINSAGK